MASDYYRLLKEALSDRDAAPLPGRPNRVLLDYRGAQEFTVLNENMSALTTGMRSPAQWGATTNGTAGGNFAWNVAGGWG